MMCFGLQDVTKLTVKPSNDDKETTASTQELLVNVLDIERKTKKFDKEKSALSHFDYFLQHHRREPTGKEATKDFRYFWSYQEITFKDLEDQEIFGQLANYFSAHARKYLNPKNALLKFNSAQGYFSSVKNYFMDKHKGKADNLPCFSPRIWTKYYKNLHSIKSQSARNKNEKLVDAKDRAEDGKVWALGAVCLWEGTREAIDFFL